MKYALGMLLLLGALGTLWLLFEPTFRDRKPIEPLSGDRGDPDEYWNAYRAAYNKCLADPELRRQALANSALSPEKTCQLAAEMQMNAEGRRKPNAPRPVPRRGA